MKRIGTFATLAAALVAGLVWPGTAAAGKALVVKATASRSGDGAYSFTATVAHADSGWEHYADKFEVLSPDGKVLGTRVLLHPHENEQPFTRDLGNVRIPAGITSVVVRAWDNVHKAGEQTFTVKLPGR